MSAHETYRVASAGRMASGKNFPSQKKAYDRVCHLRKTYPAEEVWVWIREAGSDQWGLFEIVEATS